MNHLLILPILIPLAAGIACAVPYRAGIRLHRAISTVSSVAMAVIAALLLLRARDGGIEVYALGAWVPPFGIVLVLDRLAALMVALCAGLALPALLYAIGGADARGRHFHALFQLQIAGLNGAFLTGDLFNLFVFFEVLLLASYGLLVHGNGRAQIRAGVAYVVLNLTGSALFLVALGLLYGTLGTLNMADMARVAPVDPALVGAAAALLMVVFALKAALLPLSFWLPHVYAAAPAPVAALFAIMTKVGVYALMRVSALGLGAGSFGLEQLQPWLTWLAVATIAIGTIGALAARRLASVVANLVVVSTGTLLAAAGLPGGDALAAALYYLVHTTLVSAAFFLLADRIAAARGEAGDSFERAPLPCRPGPLAGAYFVLTLALCGMPPLSGFIGKLMVMMALRPTPMAAAVWTALLLSSLLPALVLARAASLMFWEPRESAPAGPRVQAHWPTVAVVALIAASPVLSALAAPLSSYARATADQMREPEGYIESVLGGRTVERSRRP